jgi:hypothetical protein
MQRRKADLDRRPLQGGLAEIQITGMYFEGAVGPKYAFNWVTQG